MISCDFPSTLEVRVFQKSEKYRRTPLKRSRLGVPTSGIDQPKCRLSKFRMVVLPLPLAPVRIVRLLWKSILTSSICLQVRISSDLNIMFYRYDILLLTAAGAATF